MKEHEMLPPVKTVHTNPEWGKHDAEVRLTVSCSCGWHDHVPYTNDIQRSFDFHLEEIEEYNKKFEHLLKEIREAFGYPGFYDDIIRYLTPLVEALSKKPTRAEQFTFAGEVAKLLNEGDIDWDHSHLLERSLPALYVSVEQPRTKKPKPADTVKALGITLDDDDESESETPALHTAPDH